MATLLRHFLAFGCVTDLAFVLRVRTRLRSGILMRLADQPCLSCASAQELREFDPEASESTTKDSLLSLIYTGSIVDIKPLSASHVCNSRVLCLSISVSLEPRERLLCLAPLHFKLACSAQVIWFTPLAGWDPHTQKHTSAHFTLVRMRKISCSLSPRVALSSPTHQHTEHQAGVVPCGRPGGVRG